VKARLAFAAGFVVLVVALIVIRGHGYLGGRQLGGPLELEIADAGQRVGLGQSARFRILGSLSERAVRVQNVRPRAESPELELVTTVAGRPLEDGRLEPSDHGIPPATVDLRARRAGLYYAVGLIVDYRRGQRRFRDREAATLCIAVHTQQKCDLAYKGPGDARVAQVGGPSRYRGAAFSTRRARYDKPGSYRVRVTVANQTRTAIDVAQLSLDANDAGVELTGSTPATFHLAPRGHRLVRLRLRFPACASARFERLRARLDGEKRSVPLSLPLEFGC
jgi:hypothetical protein